jgi:hypothetical protein
MRIVNVAVFVAALAFFSSSAVAGAAPKDYCADLKGVKTGGACQIQMSDPAYNVNISFPTDYPDQKSVADYITQARDGFLNVAKSSTPRDVPYELDIASADYGSAIPPRGTQAVVFKAYENVGAGHPQTSFKAFNWDQTYRKAITYDTLWRVDDPLKTVAPIVQSELQRQTGQPVQIAPAAADDPMNYQDFAVTNDGVMFFFSQDQLLPEAAGASQVLVPRAAIDPMLA